MQRIKLRNPIGKCASAGTLAILQLFVGLSSSSDHFSFYRHSDLVHVNDTSSTWTLDIQDLQVWDSELNIQDLVHAMSVSSSYYIYDPSKLLHWKFTASAAVPVLEDGHTCSFNLSGSHCNIGSLPATPTSSLDIVLTQDFVVLHGAFMKETASINPHLPCNGAVFPNTWYFSAPPSVLSTWSSSVQIPYGARLQFDLMSPSHDGDERVMADTVMLTGAGGVTLTCTSPFGKPIENGWTHHSILLDETAGKQQSNLTIFP